MLLASVGAAETRIFLLAINMLMAAVTACIISVILFVSQYVRL
jgi:hypothetical protein